MAAVTAEEIRAALKEFKGNKSRAARYLDIPRTTLISRIGTAGEEEMGALSEHKLKRDNSKLRSQLRDLAETQIDASDLAAVYFGASKGELVTPKWLTQKRRGSKDRAIATALLSDTHFDEVVKPEEINYVNAYNREIATMRLHAFFDNLIRLSQDFINGIEIEGLVLGLLGDIVSGNIHEELKESNEAPIIDTVLYWSSQIAAGIKRLKEVFPNLYLPCVVGNHGRLDKKPRMKGRVEENYDYLIYRLLEREFAGVDGIEFNISTGADVRWNVYETRYQATHGDQFRGGTGISGMLAPLMLGHHRKAKREMATGTPFDHLLIGHWHQLVHLQSMVVNGSLKGYDEYAYISNFGFEVPQQAFWLTDPKHGKGMIAPIRCASKLEDWK